MEIPKEGCPRQSTIAAWVARMAFAKVFHHYFRDSTIVLPQEGADGSDIRFKADTAWMKKHSLDQFFSKEAGAEAIGHVNACSFEECLKARRMIEEVVPVVATGELPGGGSLILMSVFTGGPSDFVIERDGGFGDAIDEIKPFLEWF